MFPEAWFSKILVTCRASDSFAPEKGVEKNPGPRIHVAGLPSGSPGILDPRMVHNLRISKDGNVGNEKPAIWEWLESQHIPTIYGYTHIRANL